MCEIRSLMFLASKRSDLEFDFDGKRFYIYFIIFDINILVWVEDKKFVRTSLNFQNTPQFSSHSSIKNNINKSHLKTYVIPTSSPFPSWRCQVRESLKNVVA